MMGITMGWGEGGINVNYPKPLEASMQTKTILTYSLLSLLLMGCGPLGKGASAPAVKGGVYGSVSPFDTLSVQFTATVDSISSSQISTSPNVILKKSSSAGWILYGDSTFATGIALLHADTTYIVTLKNLEGSSGEIQSTDQTISFHTLPILDHDGQKDTSGVVLDNGQYGRAEVLADSVHFYDGKTLLTDGKSVAGIISGGMNGIIDQEDWFSFYAKYGDSLDIKLTDLHGNLNLDFRGPQSPTGLLYDTVLTSVNSGNSDEHIALKISADRVAYGLTQAQPLGTYLKYWIRVYADKSFMGRSSYVLALKKIVAN
jgi:hypothetical protein